MYSAYKDLKKAYDCVNRNLLFCKLESLDLSSNMLRALFSLYYNVQLCVKVNGNFTDWFDVQSGLTQGCILSPLLFNLLINNLVDEVKKLDVGIDVNGEKIIYLYMVMVQHFYVNMKMINAKMLNILSLWCDTNDSTVNINKSNIVQFRTQSADRTDFQFMYNNNVLCIVPLYKFLGLLLTDFFNYDMTKVVRKSASRSLGLLIANCKANAIILPKSAMRFY